MLGERIIKNNDAQILCVIYIILHHSFVIYDLLIKYVYTAVINNGLCSIRRFHNTIFMSKSSDIYHSYKLLVLICGHFEMPLYFRRRCNFGNKREIKFSKGAIIRP